MYEDTEIKSDNIHAADPLFFDIGAYRSTAIFRENRGDLGDIPQRAARVSFLCSDCDLYVGFDTSDHKLPAV